MRSRRWILALAVVGLGAALGSCTEPAEGGARKTPTDRPDLEVPVVNHRVDDLGLDPIARARAHFPGPLNYFPRAEIARTTGVDETYPGLSECVVPTSGDQKILVLMVKVNDYPVPASAPDAATMRDRLFADRPGTLRDFYQKSSANAPTPLRITGDVFGWRPVNYTSSTESTTDLSEVAFASDPIVRRALEAFDEEIDYTDYDSNGDGCVDYLFIVHSGEDQAKTRSENDIWSHFEFYMPAERRAYDGKSVYGASVISARTEVGVYVHELAHNLGLPDLYSFGPPNKSIIGYWSVMDLGIWSGPPPFGTRSLAGTRPTDFDAWSKSLLGWVTPVEITAETTRAINMAPLAPDVLKVSLGTSGPEDAPHYLLIEGRQNNTRASGVNLVDDYLPSSGVLVWEIDEGGRNVYGSLRQLVRLHDANPNEVVKGFAPEALLNDAPFQRQAAGVSSRFEARGTTVQVLADGAHDQERVTVVPPTSSQAELVAQWIRVTRDPHTVGGELEAHVEVLNAGTATANHVTVQVADIPGSTWADSTTRSIASLPPGYKEEFSFTLRAETPGHVDLFANVASDETGTVTIRDRGYIDGQITSFDLVASASLGQAHADDVRRTYDWLRVGCELSCRGGVSFSCPSGPDVCALYDFDTQYPDASFDPDFCNSGSYSSCRGEITKVWTGDFLRNGRKQVLVASRDLTHSDRCTARSGSCLGYSDGYTPPRFTFLTMYQLEGDELVEVWDHVAAAHPAQPYNCFFYGQNGVETSAAVLDRGRGPEIFVTGYCGGRSALFVGDGRTMTLSTFDGLNVSAQSILSNTGDIDRDGNNDLLVDYVIGFANQTVRVGRRSLTGGIDFGSYVAEGEAAGSGPEDAPNLFLNAYRAAPPAGYGATAHLSTYIGAPTYVSLQPKALIGDVNRDGFDDVVYSDGNGFNSSRLLVFDWNGSISPATERMQIVRKNWGNLTTSLSLHDWDGDGQPEIMVGDATDNSIHVFQHNEEGQYVSIFHDSFGGYTGTGYNPSVVVGDVDGNGTQNVIMGQGGHCSVPTVGSGVYVYGLGMVFRAGDRDGDGVVESDDGMGIWTVDAGDLDGDGVPEVVAGEQTGQLYILRHSVRDSVPPTAEEVL